MEIESTPPPKKPFYKKPLGCLLGFVGGLLVFLVLLTLLGVWAAGRLAPSIAADVIKSKSGFALTVEGNDTSLFAGRIDLQGVSLTNPSRFQEKAFLEVNRLKTVVDLGSLSGDTIVIPELIIDIKDFTFVGKKDYVSDNNLFDLRDAFAGDGTDEKTDQESETAPSEPVKFRIGKLVLRLERLRAITNDGAASPSSLADITNVLDLEFTDVTQDNIKGKVFDQITPLLLTKAPSLAPILVRFLGDTVFAVVGKTIDVAADAASKTIETTAEIVNQAGQTATDAVKGVSNAIGGLLGGGKKEDGEKK